MTVQDATGAPGWGRMPGSGDSPGPGVVASVTEGNHAMANNLHDLENDVARLVKFARQMSGLNQTEFGRAIGLDNTAVSHFEAARRMPTLPVLSKMARVCGLALSVTMTPKTRGK